MKLTIVSDLHLESDPYYKIWTGEDSSDRTLVLAGDIAPLIYLTTNCDSIYSKNIINFFNHISDRFKNIVYVPGNHEYYYGNIYSLDDQFRKAIIENKWNNIHYLNCDHVELDGKRFVGCTLWTSVYDENPIAMAVDYKMMADYKCIVRNGKPLRPVHTVAIHKEHLRFLKRTIQEGDIVITHYPPSEQSISFKFKGNRLNPFFYNSLDDLIIGSKAAMWVHGHTHVHMDYKINNTHIICNPKGYFNPYKYDSPENPYYDDTRIFEI